MIPHRVYSVHPFYTLDVVNKDSAQHATGLLLKTPTLGISSGAGQIIVTAVDFSATGYNHTIKETRSARP
jgi:hypothetical protein